MKCLGYFVLFPSSDSTRYLPHAEKNSNGKATNEDGSDEDEESGCGSLALPSRSEDTKDSGTCDDVRADGPASTAYVPPASIPSLLGSSAD